MKNIKIKICGLKNIEDVQLCMDMGIDIIGLVVNYPVSVPWNLSREEALPLLEIIKPPHKSCIVTGGEPEKIIELAENLSPSFIQLHFRETLRDTCIIADYLKRKGIDVIKTVPPDSEEQLFQFGTTDLKTIVDNICNTNICALLADSRTPSNACQNGAELNLDFCLQIMKYSSKPVITAGGINRGNIADFLKKTGSKFIDIMTGVEKSPGKKDARMLSSLLSEINKL